MDCAHYNKEMDNCRVLTNKNCNCCKFYQTEAQANKSREDANKILRNHPIEKQIEIMKKYYALKFPWEE